MKRKVVKLLCALVLLVPMTACEWAKAENQIDTVLLNFHRVVGYTEQTRKLIRSMEEDGTIKTEAALAWTKRVKRVVQYEENAYQFVKLAIDMKEGRIHFAASTKASAEAELALIQAELAGASSIGVDGKAGLQMDALLTPLTGTLNELVTAVRALPVSKRAVSVPPNTLAPISMRVKQLDVLFAEVGR